MNAHRQFCTDQNDLDFKFKLTKNIWALDKHHFLYWCTFICSHLFLNNKWKCTLAYTDMQLIHLYFIKCSDIFVCLNAKIILVLTILVVNKLPQSTLWVNYAKYPRYPRLNIFAKPFSHVEKSNTYCVGSICGIIKWGTNKNGIWCKSNDAIDCVIASIGYLSHVRGLCPSPDNYYVSE